VESLLQSTDLELFYPDPDENYKHDLLFIGNAGKCLQKYNQRLATNYDLTVNGTNGRA